MQKITLAAACVLAVAAWQSASAGTTPSADDIIAGLRPSAAQLTGPTRGIRPATINHAAMAVHESAPVETSKAAEAAPDADGPSVKLVVDFKTGSADLTPSATRTLDQLGKALASNDLSTFRFRVEGHTDTVGAPETNKDLSERRAQTVAAYLEQNFSIASNRLEPIGFGSEKLLVPTPDQTPEPRNRRVRIVNLGA